MLIIFQNFPEQFGLSSVIDFLFGTINILEKDSALNDCSLQYGYAPCDEFNGMKEGGGGKNTNTWRLLEYYVNSQFTLTQMASILGVSKSTV